VKVAKKGSTTAKTGSKGKTTTKKKKKAVAKTTTKSYLTTFFDGKSIQFSLFFIAMKNHHLCNLCLLCILYIQKDNFFST